MSSIAQPESQFDDIPVDPLIVAEAHRISKAYTNQLQSDAYKTIVDNINRNNRFYRRQFIDRARYLRRCAGHQHTERRERVERAEELKTSDNSLLHKSDEVNNDQHSDGSLSCSDIEVVHIISNNSNSHHVNSDRSLDSLRNIKQFGTIYDVHLMSSVRLAKIRQLPAYDSWVPTQPDFFVKDENIDDFVPYFGDSKSARRMAREVYRLMRQDMMSHGDDDISDGEIRDGVFKSSKDDAYFDLTNRRRRQAERYTILLITRRFGDDPAVWKGLCLAFNKHDIYRIQLIHRIAKAREKKKREAASRLTMQRQQTRNIQRAIVHPKSDDDAMFDDDGVMFDEDVGNIELGKIDYIAKPLEYFCFSCHLFACELHEKMNVEPIKPIPDITRDSRLERLANRVEKPCGSQCFLHPDRSASQSNCTDKNNQWRTPELTLLSEAQSLFGEDWCAAATIIGTKSCKQVYQYVRRRLLEGNELQLNFISGPGSSGLIDLGSSEDDRPRKSRCTFIIQEPSVYKSDRNKYTKPRFIPCSHSGTCTKRNNCPCVIRGIDCESTCGCNDARFGTLGKGVGWLGRRDIDGKPIMCRNRHIGCSCKSVCNTDSCECFRKQRTCDPDFCESCDSQYLPEVMSISIRRCRNVDLISGRHKKVFMGRSSVHGYGLFAGQNFRTGDLLGPYCGRLMDSELLDKLLRPSQAKKSTYAFNLTHDLTVDAGLVGSKVKFINHAFDRQKINCYARVERVRGECRICIKACEPIRAGQELLMDYMIDAEEGNAWLKQKDDNDDDDDDNETSSTESSDSEIVPARRSRK